LKVKNKQPRKHWIDNNKLGVVEVMHNIILNNIRVVLGANVFLSVIEVNIMNDQHGGQCGVHVYVMKKWH
jgi:hypothetical protein